MIGWRRHPSWRELNRLADGELDAGSRGTVLEHVAACPKCSRSLAFIAGLREAGRDMRHPSPPRRLLDDILQDRAAGLRAILPAVPPTPRRRHRASAAAAAAIVVGLAGLATVTLTSDAGAGASDLRVEPVRPVPGEHVEITYRPGALLAGEADLKLRVRLRAPDDAPPRGLLGKHAEAVLLPDGEGRYVGRLTLPADFAYAVMAVETRTGDRVDDRDGRLWSLRAHDSDGVPLPGALRQEFFVLQNRSWPEARGVLHEITLLYPDLAEGWSLQLAHEESARMRGEKADGLATHREIFRDMQNRAGDVGLPVHEIEAMVRYARSLEEEQALEYWLSRLEDVDPANRLVITYGVTGYGPASESTGGYLERLWSVDDYRTPDTCERGYRTAAEASTARTWAVRCLPIAEDHWLIRDMALSLVADDQTRERGLSEIRGLLEHLRQLPDDERPLYDTPAEFGRESRRLEASLRFLLGEELRKAGETAAAIVEFEAADDLGGWMPELYRARLEARLSGGDASGALPDFHRLHVDPVVSRASVDSLRRRLPPVTERDMVAGRARAEDELVRRLLADQVRRGVPAVQLLTSTGQTRPIESLLAGKRTILLLWDRRIFDSADDVSEVIRAERLLSGTSSQLLWVTPEADSESIQAFSRAAGLHLPAYHDPGSELAMRLGEWGARGYFVIDRAGWIRARAHSLMEAVRHLEALELRSRDVA